MAEISKIRRCYNCGAILQCEDPKKTGYTSKEVLENPSQNFLFCDKCFELERYRARPNEPILSKDYITLLNDAKAKKGLIVYVVNLFSFEAAFNHQIIDLIEGMNILVVANKFDLMPAGVKKEDMREYVAHRFRASGLKSIKAKDVILSNAFDEDSATDILARVYELKQGRDVYIVGSSLSGKTTLISSFLRTIKNVSTGNIVTAPYPGTDLDVLQIPISKKASFYDVPGFSLDNSILYNISREIYDQLYVKKTLKVRQVEIKAKHCFYIGGLACIELLEGGETKFDCYLHDKIGLKEVNLRGKRADELFIKLVNKGSVQPSLPVIQSIKDLDVYDIAITETNYRDIGVLGLGWVSFKANNQKIRIYVPKGVSIYTSRPKVLKKGK